MSLFTLPKPINHRRGWIAIVRPPSSTAGVYGWVSRAVGSSTIPDGTTKSGTGAGAYGWAGSAVGVEAPVGNSSLFTAIFPFLLGTPIPLGQTVGSYGWTSAATGEEIPTSSLPLTLPFTTDS